MGILLASRVSAPHFCYGRKCCAVRQITKHSFRAKREQTCLGPSGADVSRRERNLTRVTIHHGKVLFADRPYAASLKPFYLITICRFEWTKDGDVTWLQFMGSMGGQTTEYDLML
jgi:hypothetical protein